jgi:16S rRNA (uracil1498-N3)-methyltransferase
LQGVIEKIEKRSLEIAVQKRVSNEKLKPELLVLLPTLKKDDLEEALSRLCALGVTTIQFVETEKVQHNWHFDREKERFERVMIAACEQSKQFVVPALLAPISLEKACAAVKTGAHKVFFDPDGQPLLVVMQQVATREGETVLLVGPEGDLTDKEKEFISRQGFVFCALTKTVLRSCEAIALGVGVIRSLN